jgi:hypothetical protein
VVLIFSFRLKDTVVVVVVDTIVVVAVVSSRNGLIYVSLYILTSSFFVMQDMEGDTMIVEVGEAEVRTGFG